MRKILPHTVLSLGLALTFGTCRAEALSASEWQREVNLKPGGDTGRGRVIYEQRGCAGCHGEEGRTEDTKWPVLAGQRPLYVYKVLLDYQAGRLHGADAAIMGSLAQSLKREEIADIAEWVGSLPRPAGPQAAEPAILGGDRQRLIPPCSACHGAQGQGWDLQPALLGQHRDYLGKALRRFKSGERDNDVNAGMSQFAKKLSDEEIRALADYYGH